MMSLPFTTAESVPPRVAGPRRFPRALGFLFLLVGGCGLLRDRFDESLLKDSQHAARPARLAEQYVVRYPDVLDVRIEGVSGANGERSLGIDGRIEVGGETIRVEGRTVAEVVRLLSDRLKVPEERIAVRVTAYKSQQLYLQGEVKGDARSVPYVGPETVLEMLQRVGGITAGAAAGDVQVVRAHIAEGKQPEVFVVDLQAIVEKDDEGTNLRLMPFDQVRIGQSRCSRLKKCLPPWMRPLYGRVFGLSRPDDAPEVFTGARRRGGLAARGGPGYIERRLD